MLFRKRGTTSGILAIALLVAIITSVNSVVEYINFQVGILDQLVDPGGTFMILSENSTSITDSKIDTELTSLIDNVTNIQYTLPQRALAAILISDSGTLNTIVRGVEDVRRFLELRRAYVNGTSAEGAAEANVGEVLARIAAIDLGDELTLVVNNNTLRVDVVGVVKTLTQNDAELIVPMEAIINLAENDSKISLIEFTLTENVEATVPNLIKLLPPGLKVVRTQHLVEFMQDMNSQTLAFLNLWSLAVYAVVVIASYVVATRLITESSYELATIRALGAQKSLLFSLILTYTVVIALLGSILGLAIGIAGTQVASTILGWIRASVVITPFLEPSPALRTLLLTIVSSTLGCLFPAFRSACKSYAEPRS